jgi:hypothetical protein
LAASVGGVAKRALGRRGFAEGGLISDWRAVVGPELAASCWPDRLSIRVAGGFATELQHLVPQVLERVNGHFGYRAIDRISILQAPADAPATPRRTTEQPPDRRPEPGRAGDLEAALTGVEDPDIRAALARLGRAMISDGRTDESG